MKYDFTNKTVLITGAAGHLGQNFALQVAQNGGRCIITDKHESGLSALLSSLPPVPETEHLSFVINLADSTERQMFINMLSRECSFLDVIVNNAAYTGDSGKQGWTSPFGTQSLDMWREALELNLTACFDLSQQLYNMMLSREDANILNVGSIYGFLGPDYGLYGELDMGNPAGYAASKGGLTQLTRWLASTLAPKIRVNSISPGGIYRDQPQEFIERYKAKTPLKRMASEADIVKPMLFLTSENAGYITGQNLVVDGGFSIT